MAETPEGAWVTLAEIVRARGNRGEVLAQSFTSGPERFSGEHRRFSLWRTGEERRVCEVEEVWAHQGLLVLKLAGVDSIDDAEQLKGFEVQAPLSERPPLSPGEFYQSDLIGCHLVEHSTGAEVGVVKGWEEFGAAPLLVIDTADGREEMVPFTPTICVEVRLAEKRILVDLPAGLLDMNRR